MSTPNINPQTITPTQIHTCLSLYPSVLSHVYKTTRPKLKLNEIIDDDKWRYEVLPRELARDDGRALRKEELQRLVRWKITHGTNRPFLPGMVAKNTEAEIISATTSILSSLGLSSSSPSTPSTPSTSDILSTLTQICTLKGVGPATGSLVLSVYAPETIPFFEDELYEWVVGGTGTGKLKYDRKEYEVVLEGVREVMGRLEGSGVQARDIEKVAYVLGHWDALAVEEKGKVLGKKQEDGEVEEEMKREGEDKDEKEGEGTGKDDGASEGNDEGEGDGKLQQKNTQDIQVKSAKRAHKREASTTVPENASTRRSKRNKK